MFARLAGNEFHPVPPDGEERVGRIARRRFERLVRKRAFVEGNARERFGVTEIGGGAHFTGRNRGGRRRVAVEQRHARTRDRIERLVGQRAAHTQEFLGIAGIGPHGNHLLHHGQIDRQRRRRNPDLDPAVLLESARTGHPIALRRSAARREEGAEQQRNKRFHKQFDLLIRKYNQFPVPIKT